MFGRVGLRHLNKRLAGRLRCLNIKIRLAGR